MALSSEPPPIRPRAAFIDRDGVINVDAPYVYRIKDFVFLPGAVDALRELQTAGYLLVVITNQSGIARGMYTETDYHRLTLYIQRQLAAAGVHLSAVEYCPHLPDAQVEAYRQECSCRKPGTGMLLQPAQALNIDFSASILIGDRASDVQAGRSAGVGRCWMVRCGHPLSASDMTLADAVFDDLSACVRHVLRKSKAPAAGSGNRADPG